MATIKQGLDEGKVKAFIQRMVTHLTGTSIGLMLEVGRQTGLFETLAVMAPATSSAIAERAGLIERYVREWLGAMVCGGIVEYEPAAQTYRLPPEHALQPRAKPVDAVRFAGEGAERRRRAEGQGTRRVARREVLRVAGADGRRPLADEPGDLGGIDDRLC